jgi:hypothetical protein
VARGRAFSIAALLFAALASSHCSTCEKDTDGVPEGATLLPLDRTWPNSLDCGRDCVDWYRTPLDGSGTLEVRVEPRAAAGPPPRFHVELYRGDLSALGSAIGDPGGAARVQARVAAGSALTRVRVEGGAMGYEIHARLLRPASAPRPPPPPAPPQPRFQTVSARIIELEGHAGSEQRVLVDKGSDSGVRAGARGRLVDGGRTLAEIEVIQVFPEGSRARVLGGMQGAVSAETRAEIQVPAR